MTESRTEKQLKILSAITRIHQSIGATLELEEISKILVTELARIVKCAGCAIFLIEGDKARILAEHGFSSAFPSEGTAVPEGVQCTPGGETVSPTSGRTCGSNKEFKLDMPAIKHIIDGKESIFTGDVEKSLAAGCVPQEATITSLLCIPIMVHKKVQGIIHLDSPEKNAFDEDDLRFGELLSMEISIAIERSMMYAQIKTQSIKDGLTGCFNRGKFDEDITVETARSKRYKRPLSLLMIDIDWFKNYNDFHGHPKGDELLKKIVNIFRQNARITDRIYRYGGEEFAVLLPETGQENALYTAKRFQKIVETERFEGEEFSQPGKKVTISIGIATSPTHTDNYEELLKLADAALYKAKQTGKNKVYMAEPVEPNPNPK